MSTFISFYRSVSGFSMRALTLSALIAGALLPIAQLQAQTEISVRGSGKLFPIAIPQLCVATGDSPAAAELAGVMQKDLDLSGYFEVISPRAYIESAGKCAGQDGFAYSDWSVIGAEGLVRGVIRASGGMVTAQLYLHDVQRQKVVLGKEYSGDESQVRMMGHRFANEVMRFFTGSPGVFGSQIAFVTRVGRFKEIAVMDMDGSNLRMLTNDRGLSLSPSWDRAGENLVYTSYMNRVPDLFTMNVGSRAVRQITRGPALEIGAKFLPSGDGFVVSRNVADDSDLVQLGRDGTLVRKITNGNGAIDVSPVFSPDGSELLFVSNRAGGPQVYRMSASGGDLRRISFASSNYCTSPAWSPKGDRIAFVCRADAGFQMFIANPDGSNAMQLTSSGDNEDPTFSPDGRYIAFATTFWQRGVFSLALIRADGSGMRQLTQGRGGDTQPVWGPMPAGW